MSEREQLFCKDCRYWYGAHTAARSARGLRSRQSRARPTARSARGLRSRQSRARPTARSARGLSAPYREEVTVLV